MGKFNLLLLAGFAAKLAAAKDVYLNWNVTWVNASPDGYTRPVIGINGQWPCPQVDVELGDRVIVDVYNGLGNQSTGIHWHGFHQYHTGVMDGSSSVTQCPLAPGQHMQYNFIVNQTGTYWYHSHNMGQYPDGFRGAFIVHDPKPPFHYDDEFTLTLSEWYHREMADLLHDYLSQENEEAFGGKEPIPDSALINDSTKTKIKVQPNKTYLVHIVCVGNWPGHTWVLDGHEMTVVEVDGIYTEPYPVGNQMLRVAPGQRMSVLIHTKPDTSKNFAIWNTMDINMMFIYENRAIPANYNPNVTAWLVYDEAKPLPPPPVLHEFSFVDDVAFVPLDKEPLLQPVNKQIIIDTFSAEINGINRFMINNKTYIPQDVPTLYTATSVGKEFSSNPEVYGQVNPFIVKYGDVVEIVINNHHNNLHPWHLHGHEFQVLQRSDVDGGYFTGAYYQNVSQTPIRRDTIMVQNHGHTVLRFRANNPGVWLLHCHVEWHVEAGLVATIIEAPETFPDSQDAPPQSHYDACAAYPDPTNGNAAGKYGLDLAGAKTEVETEVHGAMYSFKPLASAPQQPGTSSAPPPPPPAPQTTTWTPPPPAAPAPEPTQSPPPQQPPAPYPTHSHGPPPYQPAPASQPAAPKPIAQQPTPQAPAPQPAAPEPIAQQPTPQTPTSQPAAPEPIAQQPAPQAPAAHVPAPVAPAPVAPAPQESVPLEPVYCAPLAPPPHDTPVDVHQHESDGAWPHPHTDDGSAQVGQGPHADYAHSEDTRGPWPNPINDESHAQIGHGPNGQPIIAHNEDTKGPWPHPTSNDGYVKDGGYTIKTHDNGPNDLPEGYEYWQQYEHQQ
ncbi:Multicopper oxidase abr1 [Penicillium canariense]|uniref:Multicopper oxidase abr1 n=1 Tax=Penicillium canariense TaxID=189055 RepID=A0A9W9LVE3_9EURO|nr:Multicopper oxidase abr1 [Penicillium canariense]KAJ5176867.1 Multicopper oxidase abr1 [Penicillium canariense]